VDLEAANAPLPSPDKPAPARETTRQRRLRETQEEIASLDRQLARAATEEKKIRETVEMYQSRVEASPTRESELVALTRDYDTGQKSYTSLLAKKWDSQIAANLERRQVGEQFKILDPARQPEKPFSPNRQQIDMMGAIIGLGIGLGLVALREFANTSLNVDDDVVQSLALPVLAMVPMMLTRNDLRAARKRRVMVLMSSAAGALFVAAALIVWKLKA
jgi:capsular polysaccharide biosynthesis protein